MEKAAKILIYNYNINVDSYMYVNIVWFLYFLIIFCFILCVLYSLLDFQYNVKEVVMNSTYECGFLPYSDTKINFDINFSAIAVLFIIFDLETILMVPWILNFLFLDYDGIYTILLFLFFFVMGVYFELQSDIIKV